MTTLNPTKTVQIGAAEVTVRDLPWPVMKQFLDRLSKHIQSLGGAAIKPGQSFFDQLTTLTTNATELSEYLVLQTLTAGNLGVSDIRAWLQERTATEFMTLLDAALEVVFNEDFVRLGKSVAGRVQAAFALGTPTGLSARQSISSSGRDGPTRTRVNSPSPNSSSSVT